MDFIFEYIEFLILFSTISTLIVKMYLIWKSNQKKKESIIKMLSEIHVELKPNHGSSIKDKIDKIEGRLDMQSFEISRISNRQSWLLENGIHILFESDENGKFTWVNSNFRELVKFEDKHVLGYGWKNLIVEEQRDHISARIINYIRDGISFECKFDILDSAGKLYNVKCICSYINTNGKVGVLGTFILQ